MSWNNREIAARKSIGMGISHTFDRCMDMISFASSLAVGNIYYVNGIDGVGSNTGNDGLTPDSPYLTIKKALSVCVANKNDYIFVLDYWQPTGETFPIHIDKKQVHIIGVAQGNLPYPAIHPTGTTAAFTVNESGSYSEIAFLTIGGGSSNAGISLGLAGTADATKPEGVWIHDCWFGFSWFGTPDHGIDSTEYGSIGCKIERCMFLGDVSNCGGKLAENAIEFTTTAANNEDLEIVDCVFKGTAIGINLAKGPGAVITGNRFLCENSAAGEAITLGSSVVGCMIDDNSAFSGSVPMSYIPYRDLGTNHWGKNFRQGLTIAPVTV